MAAKAGLFLLAILVVQILPGTGLGAQEQPRVVELTMETMVDLTMNSSFRIRQLDLGLERNQLNLKASRARLKSSVDLELATPSFRLSAEPKWNSDLQRNEIIQENTRRWEGELSVRQPVILFGWPTNGYLSLNNRMYRYTQVDDDGSSDVSYYNRYYISYNQPLFQPNNLKYSLEQAEFALEHSYIRYNRDILNIVSGVSEVYHDLLEERYMGTVRQELVTKLERALSIALERARTDSTAAIEVDQLQVELANARERLQSQESSIRLEFAEVKQELGLNDTDSVAFESVFRLDPVPIDMDEAVRFSLELTPTLREFEMDLRNQEISLERTKSRDSFRLNLSMSYGRERRDDYFDHLWQDPDNSYTVNLTARVPIWDWGERKARIAASEIQIQQTELRHEETQLGIVSGVRNEVLNVRDRENRTFAMQENLRLAGDISETNFQRYEEGAITAQELILGLHREADTNENFIDSYVNWKESLRRILTSTYYDFEQDRPAMEWLREEGWLPENGTGGMTP